MINEAKSLCITNKLFRVKQLTINLNKFEASLSSIKKLSVKQGIIAHKYKRTFEHWYAYFCHFILSDFCLSLHLSVGFFFLQMRIMTTMRMRRATIEAAMTATMMMILALPTVFNRPMPEIILWILSKNTFLKNYVKSNFNSLTFARTMTLSVLF